MWDHNHASYGRPARTEIAPTYFLGLAFVPFAMICVVGIFWDLRPPPELQVVLTPDQIASALKAGMTHTNFRTSYTSRAPMRNLSFR